MFTKHINSTSWQDNTRKRPQHMKNNANNKDSECKFIIKIDKKFLYIFNLHNNNAKHLTNFLKKITVNIMHYFFVVLKPKCMLYCIMGDHGQSSREQHNIT